MEEYDPELARRLSNYQTAHIIVLRAIVTLLLSEDEVNEENVFEIAEASFNNNASSQVRDEFKSTVLEIAEDIISIVQMRKAAKSAR